MIRWPISYPFALIVALLAILPVVVLFVLASDSVQFFDAHNLKVLYNTLLLMFMTLIGAVIIGVPLAFL
ncbi:MAG: iron ABC transporter permease, partial [Kangiellaceae bacterium]